MQATYRMPLYPLWTYVTGGGVGLKLADIGLSVLTVWLIHEIAFEIFRDRATAFVAAAFAATYPPFLYFPLLGITETAYACVLCAAFLVLYRGHYVAGSVLLVASILIRPALEPAAPLLVLVFSSLVHRAPARVTARRLLIYAIAYAVLMAPWWLHNERKYGEFVRINLGDGMALYEGNLCPADTLGFALEGAEPPWKCHRHFGEKTLDPIGDNQRLKAEARHYLEDHPGYAARVLAVKLAAFWRFWGYSSDWIQQAAFTLTSGLVFALFAAFLALHARLQLARVAPIIVLVAWLWSVYALTISYLRFRFPLEPFMIVLASFAAVEGWRRMRGIRLASRSVP
jgi:hypothetical protein